ncbi:MAG: iron-only hydrogenase system regulator [Clostridiales Family XIII bacterium]|nr:iron-only hydrogenase system regulator [Clostridiales Family XIII bacterium]
MENRIAIVAIIVSNPGEVGKLNEILHEYSQYIIGRLGIPYRDRGINIISVALDAPQSVTSALSGKLGMLRGVSASATYEKL